MKLTFADWLEQIDATLSSIHMHSSDFTYDWQAAWERGKEQPTAIGEAIERYAAVQIANAIEWEYNQ